MKLHISWLTDFDKQKVREFIKSIIITTQIFIFTCYLAMKGNKNFCSFSRKGNIYQLGRYKGTLINIGPHWPGVIAIIALISAGTYLNINIVITQCSHQNSTKTLLYIFISIMCILTTITLLLTAFIDAGIVVNNHISSDEEEASITYEARESLHTNIHNDDDDTTSLHRRDRNEHYCNKCHIIQYKELHIQHCDDCDVCIRGHDHHCPVRALYSI